MAAIVSVPLSNIQGLVSVFTSATEPAVTFVFETEEIKRKCLLIITRELSLENAINSLVDPAERIFPNFEIIKGPDLSSEPDKSKVFSCMAKITGSTERTGLSAEQVKERLIGLIKN